MKRIPAPLAALFLRKGLVQRIHRVDLGDWRVQGMELSSVSDMCHLTQTWIQISKDTNTSQVPRGISFVLQRTLRASVGFLLFPIWHPQHFIGQKSPSPCYQSCQSYSQTYALERENYPYAECGAQTLFQTWLTWVSPALLCSKPSALLWNIQPH